MYYQNDGFSSWIHVFVNRIINLEEGVPMSESLTRSPFFQAEAVMKKVLELLIVLIVAKKLF